MDADPGQTTTAAVTVRPVRDTDMEAIASIYGYYVLYGTSTFETDPPSAAEMKRRHDVLADQGYPYLVAERGGEVVGYAYVSAYRPRRAYWNTVENSIYLRHDVGGLGVGTQLLRTLIETCEELGYRQIIAMIGDSGNVASLRLHLGQGFESLGTLRSVGYKHGRWIDTVCMQRSLGHGDSLPPDTAP